MLVESSDFISLRRDGLYVDTTDILNEPSPLVQSSTSIIVNFLIFYDKTRCFSHEIDSYWFCEENENNVFGKKKTLGYPRVEYLGLSKWVKNQSAPLRRARYPRF